MLDDSSVNEPTRCVKWQEFGDICIIIQLSQIYINTLTKLITWDLLDTKSVENFTRSCCSAADGAEQLNTSPLKKTITQT